MYQRILVPIDGSHTATLGLQEAIRIAKADGTKLRLISVVDEFVVAQNFEGVMNAGDLLDALRDSGKKTIAKGVALANKNARIVWALLAHDRVFRPDYVPAAAGQ